jgi:hypothetical protein
MTKLSDTQLVILGAAAQRTDLSVLPQVEATRTREVGPEKSGAKGSATTYRIVA